MGGGGQAGGDQAGRLSGLKGLACRWFSPRLFTPDAHATWLLAALDPTDGDTAYGLCDVSIGMPELGHVRLSDLASIVEPLKRPILRDLYFQPTRPLSALSVD
ncbi:hypothetical protein D9M72_319710 [compost metagenome]